MAKFIVRRLLLMLLTMFLVSVAVFLITEAAPGNVARNVLGVHITPAQEASFLAQTGLDQPIYERYLNWLAGSDWRAARQIGMPVRQITTKDGFKEWWAVEKDGTLVTWKQEGDDLIIRQRQPDGSAEESPDNERWQVKEPASEIGRLTIYRDQVLTNPQLTEPDRQAILQELDRILAILQGKDQSQAALAAALAGPESALEAMMDPGSAKEKELLQKAAQDVSRDDLLQAVVLSQELSAPSADLTPSNRQTMARRLGKAADVVESADPAVAAQLRRAADSLKAGDTAAAQEVLTGAASALNRLTGSLAVLSTALRAGDYQQAVTVLRDLSDPTHGPLDAAQLAVVPGLLEQAGKALKDASAELGDQLRQAADSLEAGDSRAAKDALGRAAAVLAETGESIARSDAARQARVIRTFWGVDTQNHAVKWEKGAGKEVWVLKAGVGWKAASGGPVEFIPLQKGLLRGDPGLSLRTGRPVADLLFTRLRNSLVLAGIAFILVMPLALVLGLIAGINEGKPLDRILSIGGMMFSVTPEFTTGIFLILIFAFWLKLVPGATVFGEKAPWSRPDMLVLPVLTLTLIELGYVLRITRASMVEVMKAPYIRTAFLKGLPYWHVVTKHAVRNALMAPITIIMLHVNWLLGGIVVVEVIFGYPGLGGYLLESALFKDFNAIEAGAIILVTVAVGTQLLADIIYTFLNPRIRYG
ncbi:MAG: ABC transporter permease subunit [Ardenticatenaceae bacterium]|nr:ABC transporter permease subunit [Ardenticatenaceae bacterium]